mmetsp:Transcript_19806/g.54572  ORF Transcript_19806/g.54572 Transcript_19806/m.54572 type:complete len:213 (-) Transcript_19806:1297-1935(-)
MACFCCCLRFAMFLAFFLAPALVGLPSSSTGGGLAVGMRPPLILSGPKFFFLLSPPSRLVLRLSSQKVSSSSCSNCSRLYSLTRLVSSFGSANSLCSWVVVSSSSSSSSSSLSMSMASDLDGGLGAVSSKRMSIELVGFNFNTVTPVVSSTAGFFSGSCSVVAFDRGLAFFRCLANCSSFSDGCFETACSRLCNKRDEEEEDAWTGLSSSFT